MKLFLTAVTAAVALATATPAAASVVFNGSSGSLKASASFDIVGGHLMVTLTNTAPGDIDTLPDILHALFFDISGTPTLTYTSANICGSCSFTAAGPTGTDVGAMWGYITNPTGGTLNQHYGLSSAGYGIGTYTFVSGATNQPHQGTPPAGPDYGIVSAGYSTAGDTNGMSNQQPFIKNSIVFDLGAFNGSLSGISNIRFQYNTDITGTNFPGTPGPVPEPATWAMMLMGFAGIGLTMRRRRKPGLVQIA